MMADAIKTLWFDELDSTNAEARRRAEAGETGDLWIAARRQTEGRGRRGRIWESPEGNLHATLLTTTDKPPAEAAQLSFVAALAVAELCDAYVPESLVRLKWPNDVLIDGRKAAGVLIESGANVAGGLWLAVGVGVNLAAPPVTPERPATSLASHFCIGGAPPPTPEDALDRLTAALVRWRANWERAGFDLIQTAWSDRAYGLGELCTARLSTRSIEGIANGLDEFGALRLQLSNGDIVKVTAGDVIFDQVLLAGPTAS